MDDLSSKGNMSDLHDLLQEILEIQKNVQNNEECVTRAQEIIKESSKMVENSTCSSEIMVDAKILQVGTTLVSTNVSQLTTNLIGFNKDTYTRGILEKVHNSGGATQAGEEWKSLAPHTYHLFKKSNPLTFMLGPLVLKPLSAEEEQHSQSTQVKHRAERQKKKEQAPKNTLASETDREEAEEEGTDVYQHILRCLVREYTKNKKKPISYFNFVIDPHDYWRTVQNIFHFSFLVRDGSVKMTLHKGMPWVEPVVRKPETGNVQKVQNSQFCLTLSMEDWEKLIEKYQVETCGIPPFVQNVRC
ncbi:hypothetical protein RUM43_008714 [Polyplax serrata]|uniref:Non-structural maintenance of chromosomes element 4 n=1 Tax=Polyplax serrata TaxID=468196 RepID=A0AAN8S1I3_POLSC